MKILQKAGLILISLFICIPNIAYAEPSIPTLQNKIENLNDKFELSVEAYNLAKENYNKLKKEIAETEQEIVLREQRVNELKVNIKSYAEILYRGERLSLLIALLDADDLKSFINTIGLIQYVNEKDSAIIENLTIEEKYLEVAKIQLASKKKEAANNLEQMRANKIIIESQLKEYKTKLNNLTYIPVDINFKSNNPIVLEALKQLGKPYVWGTAGPNSFDCSGLTMYVYSKFGIQLSHYSGAQLSQGARVSKTELQPADLVFFGFPIHHVAMYIGGGQIIHAPVPGDVVRVVPLSSIPNYAGACRPTG